MRGRFRKFIQYFIVSLFFSLSAKATDFPLLKISHNEKVIWLVGSMHIGNISDNGGEKLLELVDKSDAVCFEGDPRDQANATRIANQLNFNPDDTTLRQRLGDAIFKKVTTHLPLLFSNGRTMPDASPFLIGNALTMTLPDIQKTQLNLSLNNSLDAAIQQLATAKGKQIKPLENNDAMLKASERISDKEWQTYISGLLDILDCPACTQQYSENMVHAFNLYNDYESNYRNLKDAFKSNLKAFAIYEKFYFGQRNIDMAKEIEYSAIKNGKCDLVAIGAGHLGGEHGVVNLLKKRGLKIDAISSFSN